VILWSCQRAAPQQNHQLSIALKPVAPDSAPCSLLVAFILISVAASGLIVVSGRAAGSRFPWPTFSLSSISPATAPSAFVVTKTADTNNTCLPGDCSLREAIKAMNLDPDTSTIAFDIPNTDGGCTGGVCAITLSNGELFQQRWRHFQRWRRDTQCR